MSKRTVGKDVKKVDARAKVTGEAKYTEDLKFDNPLHVRVKRAPYPHAYLRKLDVSRAEAIPGVKKVITKSDYPDINNFGLIIKDQPVLVGIDEKMRYMGDALAIVIAETRQIANAAVEKIEAEVEKLEVIDDPLRALEEDAPAVHEEGSPFVSDLIDPNLPSQNVVCDHYIDKGDVEKGFAESDIVVEKEYTTQHLDHVPLQVEKGYALQDKESGIIKIWAASQWLHDTQADVAQALNLPKDQIQIIQPTIGGAFGKKEDVSVHIHLAMAALETDRPLEFCYNREESMITQSKRHPMIIRHKTGLTEDGYLRAWESEVIGDTGAYASSGPAVVHKGLYHCTGPYNCPNVRGKSYTVYTNNTYGGAMRGFGATQMGFAYDSQMDILADKVGMDPAQFRHQNAYHVGSKTPNGQKLTRSVNVRQTIEEILDMSRSEGGDNHEKTR